MWCIKCAQDAGVTDVQSVWWDLSTEFVCHNCGQSCGGHGVQGWDILLARRAMTEAQLPEVAAKA